MHEKISIVMKRKILLCGIFAIIMTVAAITGNTSLVPRAEAAGQSLWYQEEGLEAAEDAAEGVVIAVIDTGVDTGHDALKESLWINEAEKNGVEGVDDDGNGFVDDVYGYNVKADNGDITDTDGHGTHVAGILGMQTEQGPGFGYGARLMIVKAGDSQNGFSAENCVKAIRYAVQNGADVINMSLGADYLDEKLKKAIREASRMAVIVAAAGNEGAATKESGFSDSVNIFPAGMPEVLGVMAYDSDRDLAWFSNWDYTPGTDVDYELAAPGVDIYSTWPGDRFKKQSGTSLAAPVAAGACGALVRKWKENGDYEPAAMIGQLVFTADRFVGVTDQKGERHSFPRINLEKALEVTPQPRLHIRKVAMDDSTKRGTDKEKDGIPQKGESFPLSLEFSNLWAKARNIRVNITTDCEVVTVKMPDEDIETLGSRAVLQTTEKQNAVLTFSDDMEEGQSVLLEITLRYQNGYAEDGKEYVTKGKLLLQEGEKKVLYYEEQFSEEQSAQTDPKTPEPSGISAGLEQSPAVKVTEPPGISGSMEPEQSLAVKVTEPPGISGSMEPEQSPAVKATELPGVSPGPEQSPAVKATELPGISPGPEQSPAVKATELPGISAGPEQSPAVKATGTQRNTGKTKTGLYKIQFKRKKKKLIVTTEAKAEIVVKIYPQKRTEKHFLKKKRCFVYKGKADKTGRYVLKTDRIKKKYKIQIRVCKKGKAAVIQKWRLSC